MTGDPPLKLKELEPIGVEGMDDERREIVTAKRSNWYLPVGT